MVVSRYDRNLSGPFSYCFLVRLMAALMVKISLVSYVVQAPVTKGCLEIIVILLLDTSSVCAFCSLTAMVHLGNSGWNLTKRPR